MGLIEQAKRDLEQITGNTNEFGVPMTLIAPNSTTLAIVGIHAKHHTGFDEQGFPVNSKIASIAISEKQLTDASYPVRDANGEVNLRRHKVRAYDSTGIENEYMIDEFFPDETIGLIVCILKDYEQN